MTFFEILCFCFPFVSYNIVIVCSGGAGGTHIIDSTSVAPVISCLIPFLLLQINIVSCCSGGVHRIHIIDGTSVAPVTFLKHIAVVFLLIHIESSVFVPAAPLE